ncbi:MAG: hypothetical protein EOO85_07250 [Pedobacter sp.]|nr:MAG: hypothetical protein EOO85_07250 [Pedobacter sp.]
MEIIVHLHGNAPGSGYIDNLKVGDELRIVFPRGHKMYNDAVKRQVFFGDETSLAFAFAMHPFLKQNHHEYHFYLELDAVNAGIPDLLGLDNCTVLTKRETFISEQLLAMLPVFSEQVWKDANFLLTGNAKSVQTIRKAIKRIDITGRIFAKAYWAEGRAGL